MSDFTTRVVIDSREPEKVSQKYQQDSRVMSVLRAELPSGDIVIEGVMFERKTPEDFAAAIMDSNRNVFEQLERMEEASDYPPILLIEGNMEDFVLLTHTRIKPQALRGAVASLAGRWGVQVLFCSSLYDIVDMSLRLAEKMTTEDSGSTILHSGSVVDKAPITQRVFGCIDGVGPVMAEELYESFPSVRSACEADISDFEDINGVGPKTAQRISDALSGVET